jgi:protein required for attachment to host cells
MKPKTIWVVVADEAIARFLHRPKADAELRPLEEMTDPAAHADGAELRSDAVGRRAGGAPVAQQSNARPLRDAAGATASAGEGAQHLQAQAFARRVAQRLAEAQQQHSFDELRVVAAPRFLGLLRKAFSPQVASLVTDEINKDLVHASNREITDQLVPPGARH